MPAGADGPKPPTLAVGARFRDRRRDLHSAVATTGRGPMVRQGVVGSGIVLPDDQKCQSGQGHHTVLLGEGVAGAVDIENAQPEGDGDRVLGSGDQLQQRLLHAGGTGAADLHDAAVETLGAGQVAGSEASQCVPVTRSPT